VFVALKLKNIINDWISEENRQSIYESIPQNKACSIHFIAWNSSPQQVLFASLIKRRLTQQLRTLKDGNQTVKKRKQFFEGENIITQKGPSHP
jgi:macrodomain Ter protein organizer (MatP/YcbG family)